MMQEVGVNEANVENSRTGGVSIDRKLLVTESGMVD